MDSPILYRPGQPIDTRQPLVLERLHKKDWGPLEAAYPEIKTAGPAASFRAAERVVIYPPAYFPRRLLQATLSVGDSTHIVYPHPTHRTPTAVLVHVVGGYAALYIYRLTPGRSR